MDDQAVARWVADLQAEGRPAKTIANYHGLFEVLGYALKKQLRSTTRAPTPSCRTGGGSKPRVITTLAEVEYAVLRAHLPAAVADLVEVAVGTGARWGELTALRVGDPDLNAGTPTLRIMRARTRTGTPRERREPRRGPLRAGAAQVPRVDPHHHPRPASRRGSTPATGSGSPMLRPLRSLRVLTVMGFLDRQSGTAFRGRVIGYVIAATALVIGIAATVELDADRHGAKPNIAGIGDARPAQNSAPGCFLSERRDERASWALSDAGYVRPSLPPSGCAVRALQCEPPADVR